jgi:hypothetical protein
MNGLEAVWRIGVYLGLSVPIIGITPAILLYVKKGAVSGSLLQIRVKLTS